MAPYTPENNPMIPGDPFSYDLKWMVDQINGWKDPADSADRAKASEEAAALSAEAADLSEQAAADSAEAAADSKQAAADYAAHIADPVSGLVTDWLADHITQPTTPAIDTSLTVAGAAADAKATGDAVNDLKSAMSEHKDAQITYKDLDNPTVVDGFYKASDGSFNSNPVLVTKKVAHTAGTSYRYIGRLYGSAGYYGVTYLNSSDVVIGGKFISNTTETWEDAIINPPVGTATVAFTTNKDNSANNVDSYMHVQQIVSIPIEDKQYQGDLGFLDIMPLDADYMHIPIYGQSLSIGADAPYHNDGTADGLFMLGGLDNVGMNEGFKLLELTSGYMNPIVPALHDLKKIADSNGINHRIIATSSGKGARSIAQLMSQARQIEIKTERSLDYNIDVDSPIQYLKWADDVNKIKTIVVDRLGLSVKCPAIVFLQGERDFYTDAQLNTTGAEMPNAYACGDNKALYKTYVSRLKDDMQAYVMNKYGQTVKPIFAIYPCSGEFITTTTMGITMAQQEFARENDDVILLAPQYPVPNYNNGHCSTNGYRWLGEYIGKALAEVFVHGNKTKQLEAHSGYVIGNKAFISTDGGCLPLVIDNYTVQQKTNCGFKLYVNGAEAIITKVETQGHFIILTSTSDMDSATKIEVTYAQNVFGGHGNIRDSLPYKGQYSYLDDTSDTGTSGTLSITYRTKDKDGNSIIGQRYPMQNWLVPFYLKIVG